MKRKTHLLRNSIIILLACGVAGIALASALFFGDPFPTCATATLQITFDGAAEGIAPNGTAFNIAGIASDEVLSDALAELSLESAYAPEQLRPCLIARGVYPEDMAGQVMSYESLLNFAANREMNVGDFHPTTFNVALYNDFDPAISRSGLESLLKAVMEAYARYFSRVYANGLDAEKLVFTLDEYDYPQQLEIIQTRLDMMSVYAQEMYEKRPTFRYEGMGFNDISVRLNNLISSDIARLNADLTMNALTRDTARLLTQYQFEIRDLSNRLEKQTEQLAQMDALIASYDKNEIIYLSTADALTKIDGNSSETYDALVNRRKDVADGITGINSQIATYQLKLSDLLKEEATQQTAAATPVDPGSAPDQAEPDSAVGDVVTMTEDEIAEAAAEAERLAKAQTAALEESIDALVAKSEAIIGDFKAMLQAYNDQEINGLTVAVTRYDYVTPKVLSGAFIKKVIMTAGPFCAVGFMICMAMVIVARKREGRA